MTKNNLKKMGLVQSILIYVSATLLMILQTQYTIPYLSKATGEEPILFWFIVGALGIFLPLLITAIIILKKEGLLLSFKTWEERLRFRKMSKKDWILSFGGIIIVGFISYVVMQIIISVTGEFNSSPPFMGFTPFNKSGRYWLLLVWFIYWIFNIMGEEILWRGVMQPRQEVAFGKYAWIIQAIGWTLFHIAFGWKHLLVIMPLTLIMPYIIHKTKNSWVGVVMHAIINGPSFIAISLGLI